MLLERSEALFRVGCSPGERTFRYDWKFWHGLDMNGDMEDYSLEEEVTLAMEEVNENEKDLKQLIQLAQFLFERSQDLQSKTD